MYMSYVPKANQIEGGCKMNLSKLMATSFAIAFMLGSPLSAQQKTAAKPAEPKKPVYTGKDIPQGQLDNLMVKVGAGGVTKADYDFFLLKAANKSGKQVGALSGDEKKAALFSSIDEELLFQGAMAEGALRDEYICWMILGTYKSGKTTAKIDPSSFTDTELENYYKAHPEKFSKPAQVNVKGLKFTNATEQEVQNKLKQATANPESIKDWVDIGWIKEGNAAGGLPLEITNPLTKLKKGQNSGIVNDKTSGWKFIFLVTDRIEPELIPFAEAKGKVKFELAGAKQEEMKKRLVEQQSKGQKGISEDEILLNSALQNGAQRELQTRRYIVEWYISKKKMPREQLLQDLKKKFKIDILKTE